MANVKLSQIASGGAVNTSTDTMVAVRSGTTDVLVSLGTLASQSGTFSGTSSGTNTGDQTNIPGNAATVTTNANLTGVVTSVGNATYSGRRNNQRHARQRRCGKSQRHEYGRPD